jgi:hypothetical protein
LPHTTRAFRGDILVRQGVLGLSPTSHPQHGWPFGPWNPEGPFPHFIAATERCDFLAVFSCRFVFSGWRYLGAPAFRPRSATIAGPTDRSWVRRICCSWYGFLQGTARFWGTSQTTIPQLDTSAPGFRRRGVTRPANSEPLVLPGCQAGEGRILPIWDDSRFGPDFDRNALLRKQLKYFPESCQSATAPRQKALKWRRSPFSIFPAQFH